MVWGDGCRGACGRWLGLRDVGRRPGAGAARTRHRQKRHNKGIPRQFPRNRLGWSRAYRRGTTGPITVRVNHPGSPATISALDAAGKLHPIWQCPAECNAVRSFTRSPDGTRIAVSAFTPNRSGFGPPVTYDGLHVIDVATGRDIQVAKAGSLPGRRADRPLSYSGLAWSPDRRGIAYTSVGKNVGIVNARGTKHRVLETGIREVSDPTLARNRPPDQLLGMGARARRNHLGNPHGRVASSSRSTTGPALRSGHPPTTLSPIPDRAATPCSRQPERTWPRSNAAHAPASTATAPTRSVPTAGGVVAGRNETDADRQPFRLVTRAGGSG